MWNLTKPRSRDRLKEIAPLWRSEKSELDNFLQNTMYWGDSTSSAGELRSSTATPGNARYWFVPRSQTSYRRDGDIFIVSDESRVVIFDSDESVTVFSNAAAVRFHNPISGTLHSLATTAKWVTSHGTAALSADGVDNVTFGLTYNTIPAVSITPSSTDDASATSFTYAITAINGSGMSVAAHYVGAGAASSNPMIYWRSTGTSNLT